MKNTINYINTVNTAHRPLSIIDNLIFEAKSAEGIKKCLIRFYLDYSTSMARNRMPVYNTVIETLETLAKKNGEAIDCEFLCQIVFVGDEVKFFTDEPLYPSQLLEIFHESDYKLEGSTKIGKWIESFDKDYSRSSGYLTKLKEYGYKAFNIIFTDFMATDDATARYKALDSLKNNTYYPKFSSTLCVFFGPDNKKNEAEAVAGSADNIVAVSGNLFAYLTPMIIGSTVAITDATHVNNGTSHEVATDTMGNIANGESGASNTKLSPDELAKAMDDILKGTA